jgi:hypothetical protein
VAYRRSGTTWTDPAAQTIPSAGPGDTISPPTITDVRHMIHATTSAVDELVESGANTWASVHTYALATLGIKLATSPQLSDDGLYLVFEGQAIADSLPSIYFASRDSLDDSFAAPIRVNGTEGHLDPVMSQDCSKLYFDDATTVKYVTR